MNTLTKAEEQVMQILWNEKEGFVYGIDRSSNTATKYKISVSKIVGKQILVTSGLENVKEVVTFGAPYLRNGSAIHIVE
mgnify:CR=1 FL=1